MNFLRKSFLWIIYFGFAAFAMATHTREPLFMSEEPYSTGKLVTWVILICFLVYSLYCTKQEDIFQTFKKLKPYHWFRQITLDLYIGLLIPLTIIYLDQGLSVMMMWVIPMLLLVNLASLLYLAINFQSLLSYFVA